MLDLTSIQQNFIMKFAYLAIVFCAATAASGSTLNKRSEFAQGEPIGDNGKGGPILGK
jgi:oxalate decarboxylase